MDERFLPFRDRIVGVIDLRGGQAVHAVAGKRTSYQPVPFSGGDPLALLNHYQSIGVSRFYLADLDALEGKAVQSDVIDGLMDHTDALNTSEFMVDLGWQPDRGCETAIADIESRRPTKESIRWVAATESMRCVDELSEMTSKVDPSRVILSLDFRGGVLLGPIDDVDRWCVEANRLDVSGIIVLDLASVGTGQGVVTDKICQQARMGLPKATIYSGGGVRSVDDLRKLLRSGCDQVLMASSLFPKTDQRSANPPD